MELLQIEQAASLLLQQDWILLLCHQSPDGDTIGSGYGLCQALHQLGRYAAVICTDPIPRKMDFVTKGLNPSLLFPPESARFVVSVDIADTKLMGDALSAYQEPGRVDLAIDHHPSHKPFAKRLLLRGEEAANCQIIYDLLGKMGIACTPEIAGCLYLGISTDTGCFRFSNTQPRTHQIAAELMKLGAGWFEINRDMFEIKTQAQMTLEQEALKTLRYYCHGKAASLVITQELLAKAGADYEETERLVNIPRSIEGVEIGAVLKERPEGGFKVSLRTGESVDASRICAVFGGGGHKRAAGCLIKQDAEQALGLLSQEFEKALQ